MKSSHGEQLLCVRLCEAEQQRALIAEAAWEEADRKQYVLRRKLYTDSVKLVAATTLIEFSQQEFIKEQSTHQKMVNN